MTDTFLEYPPSSPLHAIPGFLKPGDDRLIKKDFYNYVRNVKIKITWNSRYSSGPKFPVIGASNGDSMRTAYLFVDKLTTGDTYKGFPITSVWVTSKS